MSRRRLAALVLGLAAVNAQAGHLVAYGLRFGGTAQQIQSAGVHAYFPPLLKTASGVVALGLVGSLFAIALARVASGRMPDRASAPSFVRLLAILFTLQLAAFATQETVEALLAGAPVSSAEVLLLWGTAGQLPVAILGAIALRWLLARVRPALAALAIRPVAVSRPLAYAVAPLLGAPAPAVVLCGRPRAAAFTRRGPPSF